jgi:C_GCAxxG_C_C family probable redox protein
MKQSKGELAKEYFQSGANCAQAVLAAYHEECGLDEKTAFRLASGFGAGMGRMREVCGAVSGMALTLGLFSGSSDPSDKAGKMENYAHVQAVCEDFRQMNGSIIRRELLALSENPEAAKDVVPANVSERTPQFYKKRPCSELVYEAAGIVAAKMEELKNASVHG